MTTEQKINDLRALILEINLECGNKLKDGEDYVARPITPEFYCRCLNLLIQLLPEVELPKLHADLLHESSLQDKLGVVSSKALFALEQLQNRMLRFAPSLLQGKCRVKGYLVT